MTQSDAGRGLGITHHAVRDVGSARGVRSATSTDPAPRRLRRVGPWPDGDSSVSSGGCAPNRRSRTVTLLSVLRLRALPARPGQATDTYVERLTRRRSRPPALTWPPTSGLYGLASWRCARPLAGAVGSWRSSSSAPPLLASRRFNVNAYSEAGRRACFHRTPNPALSLGGRLLMDSPVVYLLAIRNMSDLLLPVPADWARSPGPDVADRYRARGSSAPTCLRKGCRPPRVAYHHSRWGNRSSPVDSGVKTGRASAPPPLPCGRRPDRRTTLSPIRVGEIASGASICSGMAELFRVEGLWAAPTEDAGRPAAARIPSSRASTW